MARNTLSGSASPRSTLAATTYYDPAWLKAQGYELSELMDIVAASVERGEALPESVLRANI